MNRDTCSSWLAVTFYWDVGLYILLGPNHTYTGLSPYLRAIGEAVSRAIVLSKTMHETQHTAPMLCTFLSVDSFGDHEGRNPEQTSLLCLNSRMIQTLGTSKGPLRLSASLVCPGEFSRVSPKLRSLILVDNPEFNSEVVKLLGMRSGLSFNLGSRRGACIPQLRDTGKILLSCWKTLRRFGLGD